MPYISDDPYNRRVQLELKSIYPAMTAGELNFQITLLIKEYLFWQSGCYQAYNDIMGALEGAKLELYRRKIAPYEDIKIQENGDVY